MDVVDEKWEWCREVGVAYEKYCVAQEVWSNKSIERSLSGFPCVCVCVCVCLFVSATRGSTAQTSKPIIFQMVVLQK